MLAQMRNNRMIVLLFILNGSHIRTIIITSSRCIITTEPRDQIAVLYVYERISQNHFSQTLSSINCTVSSCSTSNSSLASPANPSFPQFILSCSDCCFGRFPGINLSTDQKQFIELLTQAGAVNFTHISVCTYSY